MAERTICHNLIVASLRSDWTTTLSLARQGIDYSRENRIFIRQVEAELFYGVAIAQVGDVRAGHDIAIVLCDRTLGFVEEIDHKELVIQAPHLGLHLGHHLRTIGFKFGLVLNAGHVFAQLIDATASLHDFALRLFQAAVDLDFNLRVRSLLIDLTIE